MPTNKIVSFDRLVQEKINENFKVDENGDLKRIRKNKFNGNGLLTNMCQDDLIEFAQFGFNAATKIWGTKSNE